jgi:hypothetical protein
VDGRAHGRVGEGVPGQRVHRGSQVGGRDPHRQRATHALDPQRAVLVDGQHRPELRAADDHLGGVATAPTPSRSASSVTGRASGDDDNSGSGSGGSGDDD